MHRQLDYRLGRRRGADRDCRHLFTHYLHGIRHIKDNDPDDHHFRRDACRCPQLHGDRGGNDTGGSVTSNNFSFQLNKADTTTSVASGTNPSVFGQSVTFTATVTATSPGSGTPTGTVTFIDGATTLGTGTLSGAPQATTTTSLPAGSHPSSAAYSG